MLLVAFRKLSCSSKGLGFCLVKAKSLDLFCQRPIVEQAIEVSCFFKIVNISFEERK